MAVALARRRRGGPLITLVPMIDVLMIMLVFFMVTSTYLDLDQVPAVEQSDGGPGAAGPGTVLMVRIGADGLPAIQGRALAPADFAATLRERLATQPALQVVLLPSGEAPLQALVAAMDLATQAGAARLRVIRLEARE